MQQHARRILPSTTIFALLLSLATGCGDSGSQNGGGAGAPASGPPELEIVKGAPPSPGEEPMAQSFEVGGYASAMASRGALVAVGTTTGVYELGPASAALLPIVGDDPNLPASTGEVRAMAPYEDGVLVAAESGVFYSPGGVLQLSLADEALAPLGITAMSARVADDDGDGAPETHLAILGEKGAFELGGGELVAWTVEGESGGPTAILAQKERVFLAYGRRVYEIDKASKAAYPLVFGIGWISAMACSSLACEDGSVLYFASDAGIVERSASGGYSLYTLAGEGEPALPALGFALDAGKQRLYALAGEYVLRVRAGEVPEAVASIGNAELPRNLTVDKIGDVWAGEGKNLKKLALGTPLSFVTDVRPIMHEYCADCHATGSKGAPPIDFEKFEVAVDLVNRILTRAAEERSMPPGTYEKKLPADKITILKEWAVTKAP